MARANDSGSSSDGFGAAGRALASGIPNAQLVLLDGEATAVAVDRVVRPTAGNTFLYRAVAAGTTSGTQPTWPTVIGQTVTEMSADFESGSYRQPPSSFWVRSISRTALTRASCVRAARSVSAPPGVMP